MPCMPQVPLPKLQLRLPRILHSQRKTFAHADLRPLSLDSFRLQFDSEEVFQRCPICWHRLLSRRIHLPSICPRLRRNRTPSGTGIAQHRLRSLRTCFWSANGVSNPWRVVAVRSYRFRTVEGLGIFPTNFKRTETTADVSRSDQRFKQ